MFYHATTYLATISVVSIGLLSWSTDAFSLTATSTGRHGDPCLGASCRDPLAVHPKDPARRKGELLTDLYTATTEIGAGSFGAVFKVSIRAMVSAMVSATFFRISATLIAQPQKLKTSTEHNSLIVIIGSSFYNTSVLRKDTGLQFIIQVVSKKKKLKNSLD